MTNACRRLPALPPLQSRARSARAVLLGCSLSVAITAWAAAPAQTPLLSRVSVPPAPNMMITVDDSGSMQVNFIPEGAQTVNSKTVSLPSQYSGTYFIDIAYGDPTHSAYGGSAGSVLAVKDSTSVFQRQMRSAGVNRIYYDPKVVYKPWYKPDGTRMANATATAAYWDITNTGLGTFNLTTTLTGSSGVRTTWWTALSTSTNSRNDWYPGLYYVLKSSTADPTTTGGYNQYDVNATDGTHAADTKASTRTDCAGTKCTKAEELQNFANWFQYYRSRILLTKAALSEVVGGSSGNARFGLASINHSGVIRKGVQDFSATHRTNMLTELQGIIANQGTPLKKAVQAVGGYFSGDNSKDNPWKTYPTAENSTEILSCRRSYNILMTDGYYNGDPSYLPGNVDSIDGPTQTIDLTDQNPTPASKYTASKPYQDIPSNTLADYAMLYYVKDLQPSVQNKVAPITGDLADPASWQHLSNFTVGLGVVGTLPASTAAEKQDTLKKIVAGTLSWPEPTDSNLPTKIDDLFHMAVDTRGDFFLANNSTELTQALNDAVGRAAGVSRVEGGTSATSNTATAGVYKFVPTYQSGSWWGDLKAYALQTQSNGVLEFSDTETWKASDAVPAAASRNILTWTGTTGALFNTSLSTVLKTLIAPVTTQDAMINYLRGDTTNEGTTSDKFRQRGGKKLPDFVNSQPTYVKGLVDLGYTTNGYAAYVAAKQARSNGVVFVGGNGGMLHGFRDTDGAEVVAYVPKSVYANLSKITTQNYGGTDNFHQFFVDGPLLETDAYIATNKSSTGWANLLIGGLGAGGTGLFALDVTDLSSFNASNVLWEISATDNSDIGYIYNKPVVGQLDGRWFAFFGNGANSTTGRSTLFAIDLESRALSSIVLDTGTGNGAMGVNLILNASKQVQGAYVGDLKGNLWRVEFAGSRSSTNWAIGFAGKPLFVAMDAQGTRQPITIAPSTMTNYMGGKMVFVGTGKLIDSGDPDLTTMQSFYGIWDKTLDGESSVSTTVPAWSLLSNQRTGLVEQIIKEKVSGTGTDTGTYYTMTQNTIDWTTKRGWYMDLTLNVSGNIGTTSSGQRVLYPSTVIGEFVLISTVIPGGAPQGCDSSVGAGYSFLVPGLTGGMYDKPTIDTNGDGIVDGNDTNVAGFKTGADGASAVLSKDTGKLMICNATGDCEHVETPCINLGCTKARVWREILNPPQP